MDQLNEKQILILQADTNLSFLCYFLVLVFFFVLFLYLFVCLASHCIILVPVAGFLGLQYEVSPYSL